MPVNSQLIKSSVSEHGNRIDTFVVTCPVYVWYELLTHRLFSRNCSSTRAVPTTKLRKQVLDSPAIPSILTQYQKGMAANEVLSSDAYQLALKEYEDVLAASIQAHSNLESLGVSKQDSNILLLPFIHFQGVVTSTEWNNFFNLRCNKNSRPDMRLLAESMYRNYNEASPELVKKGEYHLPFLTEDELTLPLEDKLSISSARCARVSYYLNIGEENQVKSNLEKDLERTKSLIENGHWSPLEHPATPLPVSSKGKNYMVGNFVGWMPYRKEFLDESGGDLENVEIITASQANCLLHDFNFS